VTVPRGDWANVDGAEDPASFVRWLDVSRQSLTKLAESDSAGFFAYFQVCAGDRILEFGCGTCDLLRSLASLVGPTGHIVGVDKSSTMIGEAQRRTGDASLPLDFQIGTAYQLDFPGSSFDICSATADLAHLEDPAAALAEMTRVVRAEGRVILTEYDWGTYVIDASERDLTRRIINTVWDHRLRHSWIGRQLAGLCIDAGLLVLDVTISARPMRHWPSVRDETWRMAIEAEQLGAITRREASEWFEDLEARARAGKFVEAIDSYRVTATRPASLASGHGST
jgi:SAM-dependent methyltransferase